MSDQYEQCPETEHDDQCQLQTGHTGVHQGQHYIWATLDVSSNHKDRS